MDPVSESVDAAVGYLDRQTRLACATRPGQGYQAARVQKLHQLITLALAAHETSDLRRQVVLSLLQGAQRWKVGRHALRDQLEYAFGALEILQPMLAEIAQRGFRRQSGSGQCMGSVGQHYLPAVGDVGDPRRAMYVEANVVTVQQPPLATVNTHPHSHRRIRRPLCSSSRRCPSSAARTADGASVNT